MGKLIHKALSEHILGAAIAAELQVYETAVETGGKMKLTIRVIRIIRIIRGE